MARPTGLGLLRLAFSMSLLATAYAQVSIEASDLLTSSPTPAPSSNMSSITPSRDVTLTILSTDVQEEAQEDSDVEEMASFEWAKIDNVTSTSFLVCTSEGREGVEVVTADLLPAQYIPIFSQDNLTCLIMYATAAHVQNLTATTPELTYATPLPSVFKAARGLFRRAFTGYYLADENMCQAGLRVVMAPGFGRFKYNLNDVISRINSDLSTGRFMEVVATGFYWIAATNTTITLPDAFSDESGKSKGAAWWWKRRHQGGRPSLRSTRGPQPSSFSHDGARDGSGTADSGASSSLPPRGQKWNDRLVSVLTGNVTCDFSGLSFHVDIPYISAKGLCSLNTGVDLRSSASCLVTLLAYLTTLPEVFYIEPYPKVGR